MASMFAVIKALIVPAIIALLLFLIISFVVVPLWTRYKSRYSHYVPLDTLSDQTSTLRRRLQSRLGGGLARYLNPSTWRRDRESAVDGSSALSDAGFDSEDGEELGDVDDSQRAQLSSRGSRRPDVTRRLSRDLEQGFIDDSSSDDSDDD